MATSKNVPRVICDNDNPVVRTKSGLVKGVKVKSDVAEFYGFFSIPYAEPPIGDRRFKLPVPVKPWSSIKDATKEGPCCIQISVDDGSEDCLTLSVYTTNTTGTKPVYIFIHDGALSFGSAKISKYGPDYFMKHDIVVVVIQFRLGMLGFLNLELEDAPGNMALADTIEAIKWVKANIQYFGGNPDEITVGGISSGGIMAHTLLISPKSQNLFHKVIIQSGTSLSYRFFLQDVQESIAITKETLNMITASNEEVLEKLMTLDTSELLSITDDIIYNAFPSGYAVYFPYRITKDLNGIIPENPIAMLRNFKYQAVPMLIGRASEEGIRLETSLSQINVVNDNIQILVPTDIFPAADRSAAKLDVADKIKEFYFGNNSICNDTFTEFSNVGTDSWYGHITDYVVRLQGSLNYSANVYYYIFSFDGDFNVGKITNSIKSPGACHIDDIGYNWKRTNPDIASIKPKNSYSEIIRERYVAMLSNFIKYSDPTPTTSSLLPIKWEPVKYPQINYLNINSTMTMGKDPYRNRLLFWQKLYGYPEIL